MSSTIELRDIGMRFGNVVALDRISFSVAAAETVALLGPSGCGKTTTLRLIAGFEQPNSGTILIGEKDVVNQRPYERNIGLVFQSYALFPHMNVNQNLAYGMRRRGVPKREVPERIAEILGLVKLSGLEERRPSELSGGQQQRVALARALVTQPSVLLLDEPLSNLDARLRQTLRVEMKEILDAVGTTTIVVTHDQEEAMSLADRIIVMNHGEIVQEGHGNDIYHHPRNRFVADFMGQMNWLDGTAMPSESSGDGQLLVKTPEGIVLSLKAKGLASTGRVSVGLRPERIALSLQNEADSAARQNALEGKLEHIEHLGPATLLWARLPTGQLFQALHRDPTKPLPRLGTEVNLIFNSEDCVVLEQDE